MKFLSSLALLALTGFVSNPALHAEPHVNTAAIPTNRGTHEYVKALNEQAQKGDIDLLFVGDSLTMIWKSEGSGVWKERYESLRAANFGLGGDKVEHILWRLQNGNLDGIHPKVVVLMAGTNNIGRTESEGVTAQDIAGGIAAVVKEINTRLPESKVLLMGIVPRGETADDPIRHQVAEVNSMISKLGDGKRVFFVSFGDKMLLPDGKLNPKYVSGDFVHLKGAAYALWADAIQDKIDQFMK